jgi:predicted lysophospholipase L1 biosynthesis ABC-type transport system permease subunit
VACANVANLVLARCVTRRREVSVRLAIGAGAGQIRRQFFVEAAVLVGLGSIVGVALAFGLLQVLVSAGPADIPRLAEATIAPEVLAWIVVLCVGLTTVFGLLPGVQGGGRDVHSALKAQPGRRASAGRDVRGLRSALIVGEIGLAVTLVVAGGVLLRSFWQLSGIDPGFRTDQILTMSYQLPGGRRRPSRRRRESARSGRVLGPGAR